MIKGYFFAAGSSQKQQGTLSYDSEGRVLISDLHEPVEQVAFSELQISSRVGNTPRYITFPDGAQFETTDNAAVDSMMNALANDPAHGLAHKLESTLSIAVGMLAAVVIFGWLFIQYGVPAMSRQLASLLPEQASTYLGDGVLETMDKTFFKPSKLSDDQQKLLQEKFSQLQQNIPGTGYYKLVFRDGGRIGANAFALPNGYIVFTDQIVKMADDDREIISVMLHEMGHLKYRHSLRATIQKFSLAMFIMVVTGDVSTSSSIITAIPVMLVESGYSRGMESEADGYALQYMKKHQIDPEYFARMMEKLEASRMPEYQDCMKKVDKKSQRADCMKNSVESLRKKYADTDDEVMEYFASHPASMQRIQRFRQNRFTP